MIRQANRDDIQELMGLLNEMHAESDYRFLAFDHDRILENLEHVLEVGCVSVFHANAKIVGFLIGGIYSPWYTPNHKIAAEELLYVLPSYRNVGAGKALVCDFVAIAIAQKANEVKINNATGVMSEAFGKMAASIGFQQFGTEYRRLL